MLLQDPNVPRPLFMPLRFLIAFVASLISGLSSLTFLAINTPPVESDAVAPARP